MACHVYATAPVHISAPLQVCNTRSIPLAKIMALPVFEHSVRYDQIWSVWFIVYICVSNCCLTSKGRCSLSNGVQVAASPPKCNADSASAELPPPIIPTVQDQLCVALQCESGFRASPFIRSTFMKMQQMCFRVWYCTPMLTIKVVKMAFILSRPPSSPTSPTCLVAQSSKGFALRKYRVSYPSALARHCKCGPSASVGHATA